MTRMPPLSKLARAALGTALLLALGSACGGQSSKNGDDGPSAGSGGVTGRAGSGAGGKTAHAGSSSAGSGNTAGADPGDACSGPATTGPDNCLAYFQRWTHDPNTGICIPFVFGGCGAAANNYESLAACQAACPGGTPNYDACEVASDCVLAPNGCCGVCDGLSVSGHDFRAFNKANLQGASACPNADVACGACPPPEGGGVAKYFVANCVNKECVVEDIRQSEATACKSDQDCKLRNGSHCCEGCADSQWISVRSDGSFEDLVCGGEPQPCPNCAAIPPSGARVSCSEGHCGIVYLLK